MCGDGEQMTLSREEHPVARKTHVCCECRSKIDPGEKYQKITGVFDGEWIVFKTCQVCKNIRSEAVSVLGYLIEFECLYEMTGTKFEYAGA